MSNHFLLVYEVPKSLIIGFTYGYEIPTVRPECGRITRDMFRIYHLSSSVV